MVYVKTSDIIYYIILKLYAMNRAMTLNIFNQWYILSWKKPRSILRILVISKMWHLCHKWLIWIFIIRISFKRKTIMFFFEVLKCFFTNSETPLIEMKNNFHYSWKHWVTLYLKYIIIILIRLKRVMSPHVVIKCVCALQSSASGGRDTMRSERPIELYSRRT